MVRSKANIDTNIKTIDNKLDFKTVPFSRAYSFTCLSHMPASFTHIEAISDNAFFYRFVIGGDLTDHLGSVSELYLTDLTGNMIDFKIEMNASCCKMVAPEGYVEFIILPNEQLLFRCHNVGLALFRYAQRYEYIQPASPHHYRMLDTKLDKKFMIHLQQNITLRVKNHQDNLNGPIAQTILFLPKLGNKNAQASIQVTMNGQTSNQHHDFDKEHRLITEEFSNWCHPFLSHPKSAQLALYILWSNIVPAVGNLTAPSIYMSKNSMINIWSWDNCFVAASLIDKHPSIAWAQLTSILDHQTEEGQLPDFVNDQYSYFSFMKPPIYGWILTILITKNSAFFTPDRKHYLYQKIAKLTQFWLTQCSLYQAEFPEYFHGNDSGWDNSSIFNEGGPLYSPDLPTFLILQMRFLAHLSDEMGHEIDKKNWLKKATQLQTQLFEILMSPSHFVAKKADTRQIIANTRSLILYIPLLLGDELPNAIKENMLSEIEQDFFCDYGLATEAKKSSFFNPTGYWLGPVWAPTNYIFYHAFLSCGRQDLAEKLMVRYCACLENSLMAENHNPLTGKGLHDTAFAWTSAVYLLFKEALQSTTNKQD